MPPFGQQKRAFRPEDMLFSLKCAKFDHSRLDRHVHIYGRNPHKEHSQLTHFDIFGDLQDWGRVLFQIEVLRGDGLLDQHQPGLARIARYPLNWQLRQAALLAIAELKSPVDAVVEIALRILMDRSVDLETRVLAGNALSRMLSATGHEAIGDSLRSEVTRSIQALTEAPQPPVFHALARACCNAMEHSAHAVSRGEQ